MNREKHFRLWVTILDKYCTMTKLTYIRCPLNEDDGYNKLKTSCVRHDIIKRIYGGQINDKSEDKEI